MVAVAFIPIANEQGRGNSFHSHCLSPNRYYQDMFYNSSHSLFYQYGVSFPLKDLHDLMSTGTWSDPYSQRLWDESWPNQPYQVWDKDPQDGGKLELQDVRWECPWCEKVMMVPLPEFTAVYNNQSTRSCSCGAITTRNSVSARYATNDLQHFIATGDIWFVQFISSLTLGT